MHKQAGLVLDMDFGMSPLTHGPVCLSACFCRGFCPLILRGLARAMSLCRYVLVCFDCCFLVKSMSFAACGSVCQAISDPELRQKKLNAELANGRLAMMAIIGMFFQDGLTGALVTTVLLCARSRAFRTVWSMTVQIGAPRDLGSAWGDWANYVDSPLRAFENELGVQALRGIQQFGNVVCSSGSGGPGCVC